MSDANKTICRRVFEDVWNNRNLAVIEELYAANFTVHDPQSPDFGRGPEAARKTVNYYLSAFPDTRFTIDDMVAEGDRVVVRWSVRGTHRGDLGGIVPTGRNVNITGITMYRLSNNKIVEEYENWDAFSLMKQLGAVPAKTAGRVTA
jgi:steroid delta-isomerase-like uncharacterized protein